MPEIQMPKLSDTMTEGTLVSWKKKVGDKVTAGEVLAEIETDKATMEWEATEDGTLTEIFVEEGGKVNVGDKIAFIGERRRRKPRLTRRKNRDGEARASARAKEPETAPPQQEAPDKKPAAKAKKSAEPAAQKIRCRRA